MISHSQCEIAKQFTNRMDLEDKWINDEYDKLRPDEKSNAVRDLWSIFTGKNDLSLLDIIDISSKYFISEPVLFILFKEKQAIEKQS